MSASAAASEARLPKRISFALGSGTMLQPLNSSMIAVAIVAISAHFGAAAGTSWVISALYIATAVGSPVAGTLGSLFGPRRVYLAGLVLIVLGSVLGGLAPSLGWLIAARVVLGLGTASQYPTAVTMIRYVAERRGARVSSGIAVLSVCAQSMVALGPTLGGLLTGIFGWQSIMWVNLPLVLLTTVWVLRTVPDVPPTRERSGSLVADLDPLGAGLFVVTVTALMFFLLSVGAGPAWWLVAVVVVAAVNLVVWERRSPTPFVDVRLIARNRQLGMTLGRALLTYVGFYCVFFGLPRWLQEGRGFGSTMAGLLVLPLAIVAIGSTATANQVYLRRGPRACLAIGSVGLALGGAAMMLFASQDTPVGVLLAIAAVLGIPNAFNNIGNQNIVNAVTSLDEVGSALGTYRTVQYLGANLAAIAVEALAGTTVTDVGVHRVGALIAVIGVVLVAAVAVSRSLPGAPARPAGTAGGSPPYPRGRDTDVEPVP